MRANLSRRDVAARVDVHLLEGLGEPLVARVDGGEDLLKGRLAPEGLQRRLQSVVSCTKEPHEGRSSRTKGLPGNELYVVALHVRHRTITAFSRRVFPSFSFPCCMPVRERTGACTLRCYSFSLQCVSVQRNSTQRSPPRSCRPSRCRALICAQTLTTLFIDARALIRLHRCGRRLERCPARS